MPKKVWGRTKPPFGTKINYAQPYANRLDSCWLFNEGRGNKIYDSGSSRRNGTFVGIATDPPTTASGWNPGRFGPAIAFDGSGDYIQITPFLPQAFDKQSFTVVIDFWSAEYISFGVMFGQGDGGATDRFLHIMTNNSTPTFGFFGDDLSGGALSTSTWYQMTCTWNSDSKARTIFLNGRLWAGPTPSNGQMCSSTGVGTGNGAWIGKFNGSYMYRGLISHVMVYRREFTATDAMRMYLAPFSMFDT